MQRRGAGYKPKLIFTSDYHELVFGDNLPGPCLLRYDPLRIVPREQLPLLPKTQEPVIAHIRLHPSQTVTDLEMRFRPAEWLNVDEDPTGDGTMLQTTFDLPENCREIECWFSYSVAPGDTRWDSAMGANYWLRFNISDLDNPSATITAHPQSPVDQFQLDVRSVPEVETMKVRWRYATAINEARFERFLSGAMVDGRKRWTLDSPADVASNTSLVYDLVYTADGHKFTDDNQGAWYTASR